MDDYGAILDLFDADPDKARNQAAALAQAMRQRRAAGTLGTIVGGPFAAAGKQFSGDADQIQQQLIGAGQHRAQVEAQRAHLANDAAWRNAMIGVRQQEADTHAAGVGLKANERGATTDAFGNPILYQKHGPGGLLPGAVGLASGGKPGAGGTAGGGAAGGALTPQAIDQLAEQFAKTGQIPQVGRGKAAPAIIARIVNRAAELHPDSDLAGNKAGYKADTGSLANQQKLLDLTKSWEATGKANLGVLRGISQQLVNGRSPLVNRPLRWLYQNAAGDPTVTKFKAAHAAVVNEYAKILSGATGAAGVTDASRKEAEGMIPLDATPAQVAAAADVLETDAGNRLSALAQGVEATRDRTRAKGSAGGGAAATHRFNPATGKIEPIGG
ncbi:MAG TPA: hypothetical protein VF777_01435 [Phycisphaerales bacterium]